MRKIDFTWVNIQSPRNGNSTGKVSFLSTLVSHREIMCLQVGGTEGNDPNEQTEPAVNTPLLQSHSTGDLRLDRTWTFLVQS